MEKLELINYNASLNYINSLSQKRNIFVCVLLVFTMLPVSLDCKFLNGPLVFSNIYIDKTNIRNDHNKSIKVINYYRHTWSSSFSVQRCIIYFLLHKLNIKSITNVTCHRICNMSNTTAQMQLVYQELPIPTLPQKLGSSSVYIGVRVTNSSVFGVVFCGILLAFSISFWPL